MHYLEVPSPQTITLVTIGGVLLILIGIQEAYKKTGYYSYTPLQDTHNVDDTYCLLPCSILFSMLCLFSPALTTYHCTSKPWGLARQVRASGKGSTSHDVCKSPARLISFDGSNRSQTPPLISSALHHGTLWWPSNCRTRCLGWLIQVLHDHYEWYITFNFHPSKLEAAA